MFCKVPGYLVNRCVQAHPGRLSRQVTSVYFILIYYIITIMLMFEALLLSCSYLLKQGCPKCGPGAICSPLYGFVWPVGPQFKNVANFNLRFLQTHFFLLYLFTCHLKQQLFKIVFVFWIE